MCNTYSLIADLSLIIEEFAKLKIKIRFSKGMPNIEAQEDIRITNTVPIVRTVEGARRKVISSRSAGAGLARTSGRSIISDRKAASVHLTAASSWPAASLNSQT